MGKYDQVDALRYGLGWNQVWDKGVFGMYVERELLREFGFQQFPKEAPVLRTEYRIFTEAGIDQGLAYTKDGWADPEASAIREAERLATANPGRAYYVRMYKTVTKSYVNPVPPITTRL